MRTSLIDRNGESGGASNICKSLLSGLSNVSSSSSTSTSSGIQ